MDAERVPPGAWRFDRFTLDLGRRALLGPDGAEVPLRPKSFALLRLLVENPGRVVDRDAIMAAVWPDVVVGDESITQCVRDIRKALGGEAQQVLKTVARHGYLLAVEVVPAETTAPVPRVERRLAAILAADVVGYSRLVEQDEAGTLGAIRALREEAIDPLLAEHKGRIVKLMGDGAIVEFASVVDAVACAVAVQKAVADRQAKTSPDRRMVFRIGINLGDVVVDGEDLLGDGVNVAARLEAMAQPGGICISGSVFEQVDRRVSLVCEDLGERSLKNIARPVRVYRIMGGAAVAKTEPAAPSTTNPSIAVLPFDNIGGDPEQEYFSDGVTEDIITELSRFRSLFVIARNSSFVFKGKSTKVQDIARELGVDYVVEGSVRRSGSRIRVTAQLIDAATGHHLWAERYDRNVGDIFVLQDELAMRIVTSIAPALLQEGMKQAKRRAPEDLRAHDHYLRAKALIDPATSVDDILLGRQHCEAAIRIDPMHARAHAYLAFSHVLAATLTPFLYGPGEMRQALEVAERALALDPNDNVCHWIVGELAFKCGQVERAITHMDRALALNPNDADVLAVFGFMQCVIGNPDLGFRLMARAAERNPFNPTWYNWINGLCLCIHGKYREGLAELDRHVPANPAVMRLRAFALVKLGRVQEARAQMQDLLALTPDLCARTLEENLIEFQPVMPDLIATLREAGLPD